MKKLHISALFLAAFLLAGLLPVTALAGSGLTVRFLWRYPGVSGQREYATVEDVAYGDNLGDRMPDDPVDASGDFLFLGWEDYWGNPFDADTVVNDDLTLFPVWGQVLTVTFDANGGWWPEDDADVWEFTTADGTLEAPPGAPQRDGFVFDSWNTEPDGTGELFEEYDTFDETTTLYAQWKQIFILDYFAGTDDPADDFRDTCIAEEAGETACFFLVPSLSREGFEFLGWSTEPDGTGAVFAPGEAFPVDADGSPAALYGLWEPILCQVAFDGTDLVADCPWGESLGTLPVPEDLDGFRFGGWYTGAGGTKTAFLGDTPVFENLMLYPHWIQQVEVLFIVENGTWEEVGSDVCAVTLDLGAPLAEVLPTPVPNRNYAQAGTWDTDPSGQTAAPGGTYLLTLDPLPVYTVTFSGCEETIQVVDGNCVGTLPVPVREGWVFLGWFDGQGMALTADTVVSGDLEVFPRWEKRFILCFDPNGGQGGPPQLEALSDQDSHTFTIPDDAPVREGFLFRGWAVSAGEGSAQYHRSDPIQVPDETTLYAVWEKITRQVTVTFLDRDVEAARMTLEAGTALGESLPTLPLRSGFSFLGWNTSRDGSGITADAAALITEDLTFYAQWKAVETVTVTFTDRGSEVVQVTLRPGDAIGNQMPAAPTWADHIFLGWNTKSDGSGKTVDAATPISASIPLYASWDAVARAELIFQDRGKEIHRTALDKGAEVNENMPAEPIRSGYRFLGWNTRADGTGKKLQKSTVIRENTTVYAQWEEIQMVTVTFIDRGRQVDSAAVEVGKKLGDAFPEAPERVGYTFKGWNTQPEGGGSKLLKTSTVNESMTVYAQWTQKAQTAAVKTTVTTKTTASKKTTVKIAPTPKAKPNIPAIASTTGGTAMGHGVAGNLSPILS